MMTAGAAPPAAVIEGMERIGLRHHPCLWPDRGLRPGDGLRLAGGMGRAAGGRARRAQGAPGRALSRCWTGSWSPTRRRWRRCPRDGATMGEVFMRGNTVMKGYLKNPTATAEAFAGGWFHTGDLGVIAPRRLYRDQGPLQGHHHLRRREHLDHRGRGACSTATLPCSRRRSSPRPDAKWGETPCAFVTLKPGADASTAEIIAFCRDHLAAFQGAADGGVRAAAQDLDRQDPEIRAARPGARARR